MSQIISIILILNLCFAGGTILVILHGMFFSKRIHTIDLDSIYDLENRKNNEGPKNQF
ncbi:MULTISPECIES: hypothetical protein [Arenibacter]|uniref:hypothetical protein n=1 Tax=Arenibacter TaxID=178469 RepID=UPI0012FFFE02|nr:MULTISPECIES: hypothetical protein [Arenibacter]